MSSSEFQKTIWRYYKKNKRDLPWRNTTDPYKILVSEIMLQQTQVFRVIPKYEEFIKKFPDFKTLSEGSFNSVLTLWSGLGYNRRALYLHKIANIVREEHNGKFPMDPKTLETFPGIGKNTAGSVIVFSFNIPRVFIETNIRRVFIHYFFKDTKQVHDKEILKLVEQTLDKTNPREWYFALMDYGSMISKTVQNPNRRSVHYTKQSKFEGSLRQVRGAILKILSEKKNVLYMDLQKEFEGKEDFFKKALRQLEKEGFLNSAKRVIILK